MSVIQLDVIVMQHPLASFNSTQLNMPHSDTQVATKGKKLKSLTISPIF